ncbi:MAG: hypothetical protein IJ658_05155 [Kiritimatiellae bacterium]|nr:hypothetical protein [Kiritimatiellia bacterium]
MKLLNGLATGVYSLVLCAAVCAARAGDVFEHGICDAVPLDGAWEMSYRPYAHEGVECPRFEGVRVDGAVPGYWEDMVDAFRAAGMKDEFRINPLYGRQTLPVTGWADDTTLPNISGCFYYRRTVELGRTGVAVLAFEGVRNQVHVWINGRFVAFRAGFSTPFELAVPKGVLVKGTNEIVLAVSNNPNLGYCDYVSGLTTRAVFRATGGVNGTLELRFPKNALGDVYVTTAQDLAAFTVHVAGGVPFSYAIRDGERVLARGKAKGDFTLPTEGFEFWSPENPRRYELALATPQGTYRQKFGLRRLVADGEKLRLNGKPVYLRGVTEHCYFPKTVHLPRDLDYYRMITAKRKELGFNFVRFHTFVPPAEYLEATDELGMAVHIESPNFVSVPEFAAIVAFARRHPSVVIYCTGNETRIDRMAEAYLRDVADLVHARTDALFSPMSAMRGVEYALMKGKDAVVPAPFPHNAERMARLAPFCDMFTSYQLGLASYESLNRGSAADLDAWGDAYCGKPRTSHEICIDGSYVDFGLEKLYPPDSPILKTGLFSEPSRVLAEKGLLGRADVYFRNSCEWMRRIRKHAFEKLRAADRVAGFDFLGDINSHWHTFGYSVGMMDEFYRLKPGETVENVLRYNSAAVLLCDLGSDFNVLAGETKRVAISLSNYADDAKGGRLDLTLVRCEGAASEKGVWSATRNVGDVRNGAVARLGEFDVAVPASDRPVKYLLRASFAGGNVKAENEWEIYAFPKVGVRPAPANARVVETIGEDELVAALAAGERVVVLGAGPFNSLPTSYRIGMAGRTSGNYATVVKEGHPALAGMPHEGFCGWQFRRLMEGGRVVQLEAGVPFDPVIDVASSVKFPIRQAMLFEYRVGDGRLLVCSFAFKAEDPAAAWLRARLVDYAAGEAFNPAQTLTPAQLRAVLGAPLLSGAQNRNRARNPNDPSSNVRAGASAQP